MKDQELRKVLMDMEVIKLGWLNHTEIIAKNEMKDMDLRELLAKIGLINSERYGVRVPFGNTGLMDRITKLEMELSGLMEHLGVETATGVPAISVKKRYNG